MDWRVKATIQKMLGYVPGGARIHFQLQRRLGGLRDFGRECDMKVDECGRMVDVLRDVAKIDIAGATIVEVGTGWYPAIPICLHLIGADRVFTYDSSRLVENEGSALLVDRLEAHVSYLARIGRRELSHVTGARRALLAALERGDSLAAATESGIDYRAPADFTQTGLENGSVDILFSTSVLEHLTVDTIVGTFSEARRILRPGGVMVHQIHCGDHYAHFDRTLGELAYLQYPPAEWERWNNEFLYQNRLRAKDFTDLMRNAGFAIELDTSYASPDRLVEVDGMMIDPCFAHYTREQLAITNLDVIARRPG